VISIKNRILEVTYEKFSKKGYSTSLREIAKCAGLKKQSLYNYFSSKDELFVEMIEREVENHFNKRLINLNTYKNIDKLEQLKCIFMSIVDSYRDLDKLRFWKRLLLIENEVILIRTKLSIKEYEGVFTKKLREILSEILTENPGTEKYLNQILLSYMSLIHGALDGYLLYGDEDYFDNYVEEIWQFFWHGLQCYLNGEITREQEKGK
jgi:AcrR family transcriptional regulator